MNAQMVSVSEHSVMAEESRSYSAGAICTIHRGEVDDTVAAMYTTLHVPHGTITLMKGGTNVARQRNDLIRTALDTMPECAWILWVDSDQVCDNPLALRRLLDWNVPVVSGLILQRGYPFHVNAFLSLDPLERLKLSELEESGIEKVQAVGTGFLLVRREALDAVGDPWHRVGQREPDALGEDVDFTSRVTAAGLGVYVDVGLPIGHHMRVTLWPGRRDRRPWITVDGEHVYWVPLMPRSDRQGRL